jgi:hypothetical protein
MTFIDTPDIDSTAVHHRVVAEALVDVADVVVFVTSGIRYADGVPWEVLRRALSRGATVIPVLNRVGAGSVGLVTDYTHRLEDAGVPGSRCESPNTIWSRGRLESQTWRSVS